ncbi:hypothetical protein GQX74_010356 [Glossina fuscipes]|nr:hypothetical protein GQX74_010356 [Glossina fuscipes]
MFNQKSTITCHIEFKKKFLGSILQSDNGRIEYTITSGDDNNDFEIFSNGTIRTRHLLDRETKNCLLLVTFAEFVEFDGFFIFESIIRYSTSQLSLVDIALLQRCCPAFLKQLGNRPTTFIKSKRQSRTGFSND